MSCGAIGKQKYTDPTLLEPTKAGKFEAVTIIFKINAKKNNRNEHEEKKRPLTSTLPCFRPHSSHSLLFSQSKIIIFLRQYWLRLMWQMSLRIENSCNLAHITVVASMQRERVLNAWQPFNGPISRVNLPLFTLNVRNCKYKISETFIVRSWTWVF